MCLHIRKAETRRQKLMASRVKAEQAGLVNKRYGVTAEKRSQISVIFCGHFVIFWSLHLHFIHHQFCRGPFPD